MPLMIQTEIRQLYMNILDTANLEDISINELLLILQPDSLLERFAYRKQAGMGNNKDFIKLKGTKGQISHDKDQKPLEHVNEMLGFRCLHYSVTESNGTVEICIVKKAIGQELTFGYRTVPDSAVDPKDYEHQDQIITIKKRDTEAYI